MPDELGTPPPAAALETTAPIAASVEAPAVAPIIPEVKIADEALDAAQTGNTHEGIKTLSVTDVMAAAGDVDPRFADDAEEEVKPQETAIESTDDAAKAAPLTAEAETVNDSAMTQPSLKEIPPSGEPGDEKYTPGYIELTDSNGQARGISLGNTQATEYRQAYDELKGSGEPFTQEDIDLKATQLTDKLRSQTNWLNDFNSFNGSDIQKQRYADSQARERQQNLNKDTQPKQIDADAAVTGAEQTVDADEAAPADVATEAPAEVVVETPAGEAAPDSAAPVEEPAAVKPEAAATPVEESAVNATEDSSQTIEELRSDLAERGGFDAVTPAGKTSTGAAEANAEVVKETAATETPTEIVPPVVEATAVDGADAVNETIDDTAGPAAEVVEPAVSGAPEATPDPNKPPIRVDSQGKRFADNGPGKNQPEYRTFQQAHAELITSGIPFTEDDVRNRATELRTQELTEEQEKLQAAKKNESAPPPPNVPGGPEAGTNRPSPQAQRAEAIAKIDEQLKDKNLSAEQRAALMKQKQELRKDPDAEVKKLKDRWENGEDLTEDQLRQVAEFDTREAQASPAEAVPAAPELSDSERLDALYQELTNYGTEAMNMMMNGEDPTELVMQFQEKFLEANKLTQSVTQKEQNKKFMEGVFKKDLAKKINPEQSARQKAIQEKLQELTQLQLQLTAAKETIKTFKQTEKQKQSAVNNKARELGTGDEKEQLRHQLEYNALVMDLTNTQEVIRKQVNLGRELHAKRMAAVNYIHRKTGAGSPLGNMLGFMAAGAYGIYAEARYDIDVNI